MLDVDELRELLVDAWCMCVPKKVRAAYLEGQGPLGWVNAVARDRLPCAPAHPRTGWTAAWPGTSRRPRPTSGRPFSRQSLEELAAFYRGLEGDGGPAGLGRGDGHGAAAGAEREPSPPPAATTPTSFTGLGSVDPHKG